MSIPAKNSHPPVYIYSLCFHSRTMTFAVLAPWKELLVLTGIPKAKYMAGLVNPNYINESSIRLFGGSTSRCHFLVSSWLEANVWASRGLYFAVCGLGTKHRLAGPHRALQTYSGIQPQCPAWLFHEEPAPWSPARLKVIFCQYSKG